MEEIKVGLIGCGWIIQKAHIVSYKRIDGVQIYAIYDVNLNEAKKVSEQNGIKYIFNDLDQFFSSGIEAVVIASPNFTHSNYTKLALKKGLHVLCEKPVALLEKDIKEIISLTKEKNLVYMPGFVNRFRQDVQMVNKFASESWVGEVMQVEASWIRKSGIPKMGGWFTSKKYAGGGVLVDLGSHMLDLCTMFLENENIEDISLLTIRDYDSMHAENAEWFQSQRPKEILPIDVEKAACGHVLYENGKTIKVNLSWSERIENDYTYLKISGEKGIIELKTLFGFSNQRLWSEDKLTIKVEGKIVNEICFDKSENNSLQAFYNMEKCFIDKIRGNQNVNLLFDDVIHSVSLIEKFYRNEIAVDCMPNDFYIGEQS